MTKLQKASTENKPRQPGRPMLAFARRVKSLQPGSDTYLKIRELDLSRSELPTTAVAQIQVS